MKLLYSPASPFARKVRVVLAETGLNAQTELVEVTTSPLGPDSELAAINPSGKIPVLLRGDGPAVHDSRVICRYLDAQARAGLYPDSRVWEVLTLEASADAILEAALLCVYEARFRPEPMRSADWVEAQWSKVVRSLDAIEARWMPQLAGRIDAAQIALGCALGYLDFRHSDRTWRKGHDALDDWFAAFSQRPSMIATTPS